MPSLFGLVLLSSQHLESHTETGRQLWARTIKEGKWKQEGKKERREEKRTTHTYTPPKSTAKNRFIYYRCCSLALRWVQSTLSVRRVSSDPLLVLIVSHFEQYTGRGLYRITSITTYSNILSRNLSPVGTVRNF